MSARALSSTACLTILSALSVAGCQHAGRTDRDIALDGFSDGNYAALNRNVGASVCVRGRMTIDTAGVYFALQPIEDRGVIDVGFSRIISGLSYDQARRGGLVDGGSHRVCGTLRDATPFRRCDHDHCRWYRLENAALR